MISYDKLKIHSSFKSFTDDNKMLLNMIDFVNGEENIAPIKSRVFRFFEVDLSNAKYVILGMDPYPSTYIDNGIVKPVATGRSFEVENVEKWTDTYKQTSLLNIFKAIFYIKKGKILNISELRNDDEVKNFRYINIHYFFDSMEKKGTIFLNASLTTTIGKSGAHINIWTKFMDELISYMVTKNRSLKWLIWGNDAYNRVKNLVRKENMICACHPASRTNNDFVINSGLSYMVKDFHI